MEFEPAAQVVDLEVSNPVAYDAERGRAKIDGGADISVIPDAWAAKLRLLPAGVIEVSSFDGRITDVPTYYVNVSTNVFRFELVKVLSSQRTNALLARDILNRFKITQDPKSLAIEVSDP